MALGHTFPTQVRRGYDESGRSVAMPADGSRVAIGSPGFNGSSSGHVRFYDFNSSGTPWTQVGQDIDGVTAGDRSGYSITMPDDGSRIAIVSPVNDGNGSNLGHVRIYDFDSSGTPWTQVGQDIDGDPHDQSGYSVAMSADVSRVAIGSPHISMFCDESGQVRIYELDSSGTSWTQVGQDIDGEAPNDQAGLSVAMSADGSRIAMGSPYNDDNGRSSGHVHIYGLVDIP